MKVAKDSSFIHFVYPFLFEAGIFEHRAAVIQSAQWQGREQMLPRWEKQGFPKDDLLAHVERYLNPPEGTPPTAYLWQMHHDPLHSPHCLGADAEWKLVLPKKEIPFQWGDVRLNGLRLNGVRLALFRIGVGLLSFAATVKSNRVADWLDFLHYFRFVRGQRGVKVRAQRRTGKEQVSPFFPEPAGGLQKHPDGQSFFGEVLEAILHTASLKKGGEVNWWREVFVPGQLIPFAVLYVDGEDVTDRQVGELLYRVRNFFPSEREIAPSTEDLRLDHPSLLTYAEREWFVFSLEGGAFVAINAPRNEFFCQTLPDHLRSQYFLLFLLALHQKFALTSLSQEVSEHWLSGNERERMQAFQRIRDVLLDFIARGYFTQVMQREHHHRVYRKWQEVFQVEQLYREVSDEVREMHEHLVSEQTRRLERRLNLIGALIGVPALVMGFLSINLYGITAKEEGLPLWVALLLGALSFALGGLAWWLLSWRS